MEPTKIAFFDARPYDRQFFDAANERHGFAITYFANHLAADTAVLASGHQIVCAFVNDTLDSAVIDRCVEQGVGLVALRCAGYNNVDFKAAYGRLHVVRVPEYSPYAVAEHAVALMLALNRKTHRAFLRTRDGNFTLNGLLGFDMHGRTAGVIGTGKIGKVLIRILRGFGMQVLTYDLYPDEAFAAETGCRYVSLDELFRTSDIISLHCPLNRDTHHLINAATMSTMKRGVMIINTGRGQLIDTPALIEGLKSGIIGAAGLDVYEEESAYFFEDFSGSIIDDDVLARLLIFPNVLVTSHQGFFTAEALTNIADTTLRSIADFVGDKPLGNEICYKCNSGSCRNKAEGRCF